MRRSAFPDASPTWASDSYLDLSRAPYCYVLYGVKYIDPVSLCAVCRLAAPQNRVSTLPSTRAKASSRRLPSTRARATRGRRWLPRRTARAHASPAPDTMPLVRKRRNIGYHAVGTPPPPPPTPPIFCRFSPHCLFYEVLSVIRWVYSIHIPYNTRNVGQTDGFMRHNGGQVLVGSTPSAVPRAPLLSSTCSQVNHILPLG